MIARNIVRFCLLVGNLTLLAPHDATAAKTAATSPGTYSDWGRDIDEVAVIQPFNAAGYGGGYEALFKRMAHQIGGDIAGLVNAF